MLNILIKSVCYNNFSDAYQYVQSLSRALTDASLPILVEFQLVNNGNSFNREELDLINSVPSLNITYIENPLNSGYFPGCMYANKELVDTEGRYDVLIISNVDLEVDKSFFAILASIKDSYKDSPVILAPSIYSLSEDKDRNPKILKRFTKKQMQKYLFLYAVPYLHHFYKKTLYKLKRIDSAEALSGQTIYAPHGSFIVFNGGQQYWKDFLSYPVFLFGEEIHIGEQAIKHQISVRYQPELKVIDSDHASTGKENESFIRKHNYNAISYLYDRYWKA